MVKVEIDQDACTACGVCFSVCSEVFEGDSDNISQLVEEYREGSADVGEVPDDIGCTEDAANSCPVDAIDVE